MNNSDSGRGVEWETWVAKGKYVLKTRNHQGWMGEASLLLGGSHKSKDWRIQSPYWANLGLVNARQDDDAVK